MKDDTTLVNEVLEKIPNKYLAVIVASKRARAVNDGDRPLVKAGTAKPTIIAMEEIAAGKVVPGPALPEMEGPEQEERELLPSFGDSIDEDSMGEDSMDEEE